MHAFATKDQLIYEYQNPPSEVAELASMSMELLSMENWDIFYEDKRELKKAKLEQLYRTIEILPWVMIVDSFQHWIYTNPNHSIEERDEKFAKLMEEFNPGVNWEGLKVEKSHRWLRQLHIFEVPFYYIEYAISQLGALSIYRNYLENRELGLKRYDDFLKLGYSKSVKEIYETAGIKFEFSREYIGELMKFLKSEIEKIK
jgi:oligoendopeptidase F